jgi:hypothetical protein
MVTTLIALLVFKQYESHHTISLFKITGPDRKPERLYGGVLNVTPLKIHFNSATYLTTLPFIRLLKT